MTITRKATAKYVREFSQTVRGAAAEAASSVGQEKNPDSALLGLDAITSGYGRGKLAAAAALKALKDVGQNQSGENSLTAKMATTQLKSVIALYMPPSISVSYGTNYNDQEIGVFAESVHAGIKAFMGASGDMASQIGTGFGTGLGGALSGIANWGKSKLPTGGEALLAINSGSIITPRMELMFEGITRRDFSFSFIFIPKSEREAQDVEQIVKLFKKHMSSNYGSMGLGGVDGVRELEIPDFFNIQYMYHGGRNKHLNRIKQCVLQNATVEYGADRYKSYADGVPQTTKLSLSFKEQELITKDYIEDGY